MKIGIYKWEELGAVLAQMSDIEQADFFNGFFEEIMHFETHYHRENQLLGINHNLKKTEYKEMARTIGYESGGVA